MRIWSIAPSYLDTKGLVALWRETLLARKVLEGKTKGYRNHPQLERFRQSSDALGMINVYLGFVYQEARVRNYNFAGDKFDKVTGFTQIKVTSGQVAYELEHLRRKLAQRSPEDLARLPETVVDVKLVPVFTMVEGAVASWELQKF